MLSFSQFLALAESILPPSTSENDLRELYNNPLDKSSENLLCELVEYKYSDREERETGE